MQKIKSISVRACRGIRDSDLDFQGKSLILHGENGRGKSSFVDAFEFLFKGKIAHLDEVMSTSTKRHGPHILFNEIDTKVTIVTNNPEATIERTFQGINSNPSVQISFLHTGQNSDFILRRKQILDFIIAQPKGRYEQISKIIGVNDLDGIELNLKKRRDELVSEVSALENQIRLIEKELIELLSINGTSEKEIIQGLNAKLESLGQNKLDDLNEIDRHKLEAIKRTKDSKQIEKATALQEALDTLRNLISNKDFLSNHIAFWNAIDELRKDTELSRALAFQQILEYGLNLIVEFKPDICPICEQTINSESIRSRLDERLGLLDTAREKSDEIIRLKGLLTGEIREYIRKLNNLQSVLPKLKIHLDTPPISKYIVHLQTLQTALIPEPVKIKVPPVTEYRNATAKKDWEDFADNLEKILKSGITQLMVSEKDKQAVNAIDIMSNVSEYQNRVLALKKKTNIKQITSQQIETAYQLFVLVKQKVIQNIYDSIQQDIQCFYDILHPGEDHREIKLQIDTKKRGSTEILMGFYDRTNDPRAFQSEAHLDSLGFALSWLL